jgi:prephenate dehydrogenase
MKIAIVGCGLIGGSIALALKRRRPELTVACLDLPECLPAIQDAGVADSIGTIDDAAAIIPDSSIVLVATPVQSILDVLERLNPFLREGTIVTDAGSTKKRIMAKANELMPPGVNFIGGHPVAGSERFGVESADPILFNDRVYALCPYPDTPPDSLLALIELVESIGAIPITIDPEEHDLIMAMVSHLPQLISIALMHAAQAEDAEHAMLDKLAGRGFLDMTRLAASDYGMWKGILETNVEGIEQSIDRFVKSLTLLRTGMLATEGALAWEKAANLRRTMGPESLVRQRKQDLRDMIDHCDRQILSALARRVQAARKIGKLKKRHAAPVVDADREKRMIFQRKDWGKSLGLPDELIEELFAVLLKHSSRIQALET